MAARAEAHPLSFGALEVRGSPAGAEVRVDGSPVGVLPMAEPARVASGRVRPRCDGAGGDSQADGQTVEVGGRIGALENQRTKGPERTGATRALPQ